MATIPKFLKLRSAQWFASVIGIGLLVSGACAQEGPAKSPMAKLTQAPPGRVIFDFGNKPKAAASAPASSTAATVAPVGRVTSNGTATEGQSTAVQPALTTAPAEESKFNFFGRLPPPSGRSLNDARRMDSPDQGIVIKDAPKATK